MKSKEELDNYANQLNPEHPAYCKARGIDINEDENLNEENDNIYFDDSNEESYGFEINDSSSW